MNLDTYKPGQLITSVSRRAFLDLWAEIQSGAAQARWPKGKVAETRKERTEEMRVRVLVMILKEHKDVFKMLVGPGGVNWKSIEVYMRQDGNPAFRVLRDMTKELENAKAFRRAFQRK